MSKIITDNKHYKAIGDALRAGDKMRSGMTYKPAEMADAIYNGFDNSYNRGTVDGYNEHLKEFWDNFQNYGKRTNYWYGFAGFGWTKDILLPQHKITFTEANSNAQFATGMFYRCGGNRYDGTPNSCIDFADIKNKFDFSGLKSAREMFNSCYIINIYADLSNCEVATNTFARAWGGYMENITIKVSEKLTNCAGMFSGNTATNITFTDDSVIACNGMDFTSPDLTRDSVLSIVNALADKSKDTSKVWTITLGAKNKPKLTEDEINAINAKGWSVA